MATMYGKKVGIIDEHMPKLRCPNALGHGVLLRLRFQASACPSEGEIAGVGMHSPNRRGHVDRADRGSKPRLVRLLAKPVKTARI